MSQHLKINKKSVLPHFQHVAVLDVLQSSRGQLYLKTPPVTFQFCVQPVAPQSLVKPSGRLEREVAPDLGLAGAAQLGIKLGSQSKPAAAPTPAQAPSASKPSSSHRSQGHPSTSGRQVLFNGKTFIMARRVKTCMMG